MDYNTWREFTVMAPKKSYNMLESTSKTPFRESIHNPKYDPIEITSCTYEMAQPSCRKLQGFTVNHLNQWTRLHSYVTFTAGCNGITNRISYAKIPWWIWWGEQGQSFTECTHLLE